LLTYFSFLFYLLFSPFWSLSFFHFSGGSIAWATRNGSLSGGAETALYPLTGSVRGHFAAVHLRRSRAPGAPGYCRLWVEVRKAKGASGRKGERAMGERLTEAQGWRGEAPALALIFAKSLAGFDGIVREADSLPSRRPSVMQRKCI